MKNYSRVLSWQSLENIDLLKLASEASQENFEKNVFLTTKNEQIVNLEHLLCPKVGGGAQTHLCPPLSKVPPPPSPTPVMTMYFLHTISKMRPQSYDNESIRVRVKGLTNDLW